MSILFHCALIWDIDEKYWDLTVTYFSSWYSNHYVYTYIRTYNIMYVWIYVRSMNIYMNVHMYACVYTLNWEIFATNNIHDFHKLTPLMFFVANIPAHVPKYRYRQSMVRLTKFLVANFFAYQIWCWFAKFTVRKYVFPDLGYVYGQWVTIYVLIFHQSNCQEKNVI